MTSEFSNKAPEMRATSLDEAADLLRKVAGDRQAGESMKAIFRRLGRKLDNWSENRIRDVWHRDPRINVRADEVSQLRALTQVDEKAGSIHDLEELRATVARLAKYEALLRRLDEDLYGPDISATSDQLGQARSLLGKSGV